MSCCGVPRFDHMESQRLVVPVRNTFIDFAERTEVLPRSQSAPALVLQPPSALHQHTAVQPRTEASFADMAAAGEQDLPGIAALSEAGSPTCPLEDMPWKDCRSPSASPGNQVPAIAGLPVGASSLPAGYVWLYYRVFPVVACEVLPVPGQEDDSFVHVDDDTKIPRELADSIEGYFEERVLAEERWCRLARSKSSAVSCCSTDASTATPNSIASPSSSIACSSPESGGAKQHSDVEHMPEFDSPSCSLKKSGRPQMSKLLLPGVMRRDATLAE